MENPFAGDALVPVSSRDEEPNAESPLTYRERTYFTPRTLEPARLESLLRAELQVIQRSLEGVPRGRYVNLAVFDHYFQGRPQKPPLATLQWKDWRGDAVFALAGAQRLPTWRPPAEGPVQTSFAPPAPAPVLQTPSAPLAPAPVQPPSAPSVPAPVNTSPASPVAEPVHASQGSSAAVLPPAVAPDPWLPLPGPAAPPVATVPLASAAATTRDPWSPLESREPTGDQDRRLAVAFETAQDLYFLATPVDGLEFAVKLLGELVPCEAVGGAIYDINADVFRFVAVSGPGAAELRAEAVPSSAGLLAAAVRSGRESLVVNELEGDARFDAAADGRVGLEARSLAYLPLQKKDHLLGMLQLINRHGDRGFSEADIAVASYVAGQLADFLQARRRR
jgi:hypothetical protein